MNREIKFRVWFREKMWYNHFLFTPDGRVCPSSRWTIEDNIVITYELMEMAKDSIIQQYTGIKDKNSKDIYEGDIVKYQYYAGGGEIVRDKTDPSGHRMEPLIYNTGYSKVEFNQGAFYVNPSIYSTMGPSYHLLIEAKGHGIEVTGNIFENPELLK